jgi:hypothetical protein
MTPEKHLVMTFLMTVAFGLAVGGSAALVFLLVGDRKRDK